MTYYRHEDGHLIESFVADENGNYSYTQDISEPHHVFIQEEAGTKYIKDDETGGDCTTIGTWDSGSKTCTLTRNVHETIVMDSDGITLDGDGHSVTYGTGSYGILALDRYLITIRNVEVSGFTYGIYLEYLDYPHHDSNHNTVIGNTISRNYYGIFLYYSNDNIIYQNTVSRNLRYGIVLYFSSENIIRLNAVSHNFYGIDLLSSRDNTISLNWASHNDYGIRLGGSGSSTLRNNFMVSNTYNFGVDGASLSDFIQDIDTSNTVDRKPIYYWVGRSYETVPSDAGYAGIINSDHITINGLTLTNNRQGVLLAYTTDSTIQNVDISRNDFGIDLVSSSSNTIRWNTAFRNWLGIYLRASSSNTVRSNLVSHNDYGIVMLGAISNTIFHNSIIGNTNQLLRYFPNPNIWDDGAGKGNYWSDYTGQDTDGDGVGDTLLPHQGVDWYPLMSPRITDPWDDIEDLKNHVEELDIPHGIKNSLISHLNAAENALSHGAENAAINILEAFIREVEAQRGKKLTGDQADELIAAAQALIDELTGL